MNIIKTNLKFEDTLTNRRKTNKIILHCTASPKDTTVEEIHNMHIKQKGWLGIAYHYLIRFNGDIYEGRPEGTIGGHTLNQNSYSIGLVYNGGVDKNIKPKDTRTPEQREALFELVEYLLKKYDLRITDVYGHRDFQNKACPSFDTQQFRDEYLKWKDKKYEQQLKEQNDKVNICQVKDWF